jgi:hypothetical protein
MVSLSLNQFYLDGPFVTFMLLMMNNWRGIAVFGGVPDDTLEQRKLLAALGHLVGQLTLVDQGGPFAAYRRLVIDIFGFVMIGHLGQARLRLDNFLVAIPLYFLGVLGEEELLILRFKTGVSRLGEALKMWLDCGKAIEKDLGHFIGSLAAHHRPGEAEDGLAVGFLAVSGDQDVGDVLLVLDEFSRAGCGRSN